MMRYGQICCGSPVGSLWMVCGLGSLVPECMTPDQPGLGHLEPGPADRWGCVGRA